ncbi:hypothetical protein PsYK624_035500 [Phanerochaete sordida]|uniref:F-box domain-containing protein n=1 Tax=Phanerochaete sordida TaxID=48140 RepID=A0A9P3G3K7_9APHY|nr:hypothetical protein PsYK624_035500 [Phanerochaete sordida]
MGYRRELRLPPEIMHIVFNNADKPSISACTLASHAFLDISRPCLFKHVVWCFRIRPFLKISDDQASALSKFQLLAEFLKSHPTIALLIHEVTLELQGGETFPSELEIFIRVLQYLPRLQTLTLFGLPCHRFGSTNGLHDLREMATRLPVVPKLKALKIDMMEWQSVDIAYILCLFGAIDHLSFGTCNVQSSQELSSSDVPFPQLRSLELCNTVDPILRLSLWSRLQDMPKIKLPLLRTESLRQTQDFIATHGRSLQHLQLSIVANTYHGPRVKFDELSYSVAQDSLDLSPADRLETIVLPLRMYHRYHRDVAPGAQHQRPAPRPPLVHQELYCCIVATLATAPRSLCTVVIELSASILPRGWETWLNTGPPGADETAGPLLLELQYMERLEDVCVRKAFRTVEIRPSPGERLSQRKRRWLEEALPTLLERGVLRIL